MNANKELYRKRQAIVEHPYGIIKRQWGFYYVSTKKGINRAAADVGLIFVAYNLRRIFNLVDINVLKAYLNQFVLLFFGFLASTNRFLGFLTQLIFGAVFDKVFPNTRHIDSFAFIFLLFLMFYCFCSQIYEQLFVVRSITNKIFKKLVKYFV